MSIITLNSPTGIRNVREMCLGLTYKLVYPISVMENDDNLYLEHCYHNCHVL